MTPEAKGLVTFGAILFGALGAVIVYYASKAGPPDSPGARLERIRVECDKTYGTGTTLSTDCFAKLMTRMAVEQRRDDLNTIYDKTR